MKLLIFSRELRDSSLYPESLHRVYTPHCLSVLSLIIEVIDVAIRHHAAMVLIGSVCSLARSLSLNDSSNFELTEILKCSILELFIGLIINLRLN